MQLTGFAGRYARIAVLAWSGHRGRWALLEATALLRIEKDIGVVRVRAIAGCALLKARASIARRNAGHALSFSGVKESAGRARIVAL